MQAKDVGLSPLNFFYNSIWQTFVIRPSVRYGVLMRQLCRTVRTLATQVNDGVRYMQILVAGAPNARP